DGRDAGDRVGRERASAHDAQPARAFGDEHAPVRQERDAPGMRQSPGDDHRTKASLLVGVELERTVAERRARVRRDLWERRQHAALIADGWIGVLTIGLLRER